MNCPTNKTRFILKCTPHILLIALLFSLSCKQNKLPPEDPLTGSYVFDVVQLGDYSYYFIDGNKGIPVTPSADFLLALKAYKSEAEYIALYSNPFSYFNINDNKRLDFIPASIKDTFHFYYHTMESNNTDPLICLSTNPGSSTECLWGFLILPDGRISYPIMETTGVQLTRAITIQDKTFQEAVDDFFATKFWYPDFADQEVIAIRRVDVLFHKE